MISEPERLSRGAREAIEDATSELYVSVAAIWEIAIKHQIGKLRLVGVPSVLIPLHIQRSGVRTLDVRVDHALRVGDLPPHHRDPFDRLMVAQAQLEGMTIVTGDERIVDYEIATIGT